MGRSSSKKEPNLRVVEVQATTDKLTRALPVAAAVNSGRLLVPESAPWLKDFLTEMGRFTGVNDKQDDQIDALAHAFTAVNRRSGPQRRGEQIRYNDPNR
jgi:predicted phage terminase large subunit-like protein